MSELKLKKELDYRVFASPLSIEIYNNENERGNDLINVIMTINPLSNFIWYEIKKNLSEYLSGTNLNDLIKEHNQIVSKNNKKIYKLKDEMLNSKIINVVGR